MVFSILLLLQVQPIPAPDKPAQDKVVCRTQSVTGSLIASKKVCLTAAQWKERDQVARVSFILTPARPPARRAPSQSAPYPR